YGVRTLAAVVGTCGGVASECFEPPHPASSAIATATPASCSHTDNERTLSDTRDRLASLLRERIAVLDGSWGVLIQREVRGEEAYRGERFKDHPRDVAGDPDLLNITRPEVVSRIHDDYFAAGADIATTNTFTATTIGQADYAFDANVVHEMNLEGARLARGAADDWSARTPGRPRFVAGAVGPLNVTLSLSPRVHDPSYRAVTLDDARDAY